MSTPYGQVNDASGSITTGATAQTVLAAAAPPVNRVFLTIINQSATVMYVDFGVAATTASIPLKACGSAGDGSGGSITFAADFPGFVPQGFVSILCATGTSKFTVKWG